MLDAKNFDPVTVNASAVTLSLGAGPWPTGQIVADRAAQTGTILVEFRAPGATNFQQFHTPDHAAASTLTLGTDNNLCWENIDVAELRFTPTTVNAAIPVLVQGRRP